MRPFLLSFVLLLAACPGANSVIDADGDGYTDAFDCNDGDPNIGPSISFFLDADKDGYGNPEFEVDDCVAPQGFVDNPEDCNDLDPRYRPGAPEDDCGDPTDYNCDGHVNFVDDDGDGWAACEDCDDTDPALNPDTIWYRDHDGDGFGNGDAQLKACVAPAGWVLDGSDCDDFDRELHDPQKWYADTDEDAYGDPQNWVVECQQPEGRVSNDDDCDDRDPHTNPKREWYLDADGDGYGDPNAIGRACLRPLGYSESNEDCDDGDKLIAPGQTERCNGLDDDCDSVIDDGAPTTLWFGDEDHDGYGDDRYVVESCMPIPDFAKAGGDCDDANADIHPGVVDATCDGEDLGCTGEAGLVRWVPAKGAAVDVSHDFSTGTADVPYVWNAPGDGRLEICSGAYAAELVVMGANVDIVGRYRQGATALDASLDGHALHVVGGDVNVDGLTLAQGFGAQGGGVYVGAGATVALNECEIVDSRADSGAGLWVEATGKASLTGTFVHDNLAATQGGGAAVLGSLTMQAGGFVANDAVKGGALWVAGPVICDQADIESNTASDAAVSITTGGAFTATACNFGVASTPHDNAPHDIRSLGGAANTDLGDAASRVCDSTNCH